MYLASCWRIHAIQYVRSHEALPFEVFESRGIRTPDLSREGALCPLELSTHGASSGTRTLDPMIKSHVLYQLS